MPAKPDPLARLTLTELDSLDRTLEEIYFNDDCAVWVQVCKLTAPIVQAEIRRREQKQKN